MIQNTTPNFKDVNELNQSLREVLISNGVLNTKKNKDCGRVRHVGLKRNPTDKFVRSFLCGDMSCPVCRSKRVNKGIMEVKQYTSQFHDHGGRTVLVTFTLNHNKKHTYKYLHDGLKSSLSHFKDSQEWKKLKQELDIQFHYDRFETTISTKNYFHVHCHEVIGCMNHEMTKNEIKSRFFNQWNKSLKSQGMRTVSPEYGINLQEGVGLENYGLKQEQNLKTLEKMNQELGQKLIEKFKPLKEKPITKKIEETVQPKNVKIISERQESLLKDNQKLDYTVKSYSIGELEGELNMFTLFPDYENPHFTKSQIVKFLKDIRKTIKNHFYLKIHKNHVGDQVWVDRSPENKNKWRIE
jgi:hypothetical protein